MSKIVKRVDFMKYSWPLLLLTLLFSAAVAFFISAVAPPRRRLPPGPPGLPFLGKPFLFGKHFQAMSPVVHSLRSLYGPIVTIPVTGRPFIFVTDRASAYRTLVAASAAFADWPPTPFSNYAAVSSAGYGLAWRLIRHLCISVWISWSTRGHSSSNYSGPSTVPSSPSPSLAAPSSSSPTAPPPTAPSLPPALPSPTGPRPPSLTTPPSPPPATARCGASSDIYV